MWIPGSAEELENAASELRLEETSRQDFKAALPDGRHNADIAVDITAMTVDGGLLVYGIAEDENKRPAVLAPIDLRGAPERVDQVARTSIHEVPNYRLIPLHTTGSSGRGYLAVVIPPSPRAPHQVIAAGKYQHRFYGRGATGNRILVEPEVARLYERRQQWSFDRRAMLADIVQRSPFSESSDHGYLHAFVRPVVVEDDRWADAATNGQAALEARMLAAARGANQGLSFDPSIADAGGFKRHGADTWRLSQGHLDEPQYAVSCDIDFNGEASLFCGRAAERRSSARSDQPGTLLVIERIVAGNLASFIALTGDLYAAGGYVGPVDLGVAITGIRGAHALTAAGGFVTGSGYPSDGYMNDLRVDCAQLQDPRALTRQLLGRFFEAIVGPAFDPFGEGD